MIDETVAQIEDMRTHSSSEVAVTAVEAMRYITEGDHATVEEYLRSLSRNGRALRHADPSHASLYNSTKAVEAMVTEADPETLEAAKDLTLDAVDEEIARITQAKERAAEATRERIVPGETYVTIDYSTTLLTAFERAELTSTDPVTVYVMEARPRYLGRKMARELGAFDGVDARLIVDNAVSHVIDSAAAALVGMTCVVDETLYNRVGTYPLALQAERADVPLFAVGAATKVVDDAFVFSSDDRPASEVSLEPLESVTVENYSYDATPIDLVEAVITDEGRLFASS